jgi:hypothetical protein
MGNWYVVAVHKLGGIFSHYSAYNVVGARNGCRSLLSLSFLLLLLLLLFSSSPPPRGRYFSLGISPKQMPCCSKMKILTMIL